MSPIGDAVAALKRVVDGNAEKMHLKDVVDNVSSCLVLLNSSRPSQLAIEKLRSVFRTPLKQLYDTYFTPTLQLSSVALSTILEDKLCDAYIHGESTLRAQWDKTACELLSGVLDFLEDHTGNNHDFKAAVGKFLYPIICRFFFQNLVEAAPRLSVKLCTYAYGVLSDTAHKHSSNQNLLRDKAVLGPVRLGAAISSSEDYLITESLLALLARLLATENTAHGRLERTRFIQATLGSPKLFKCSKELVIILEEASTSDWDVTATRLIDALAQSDIKYPQPFSINEINACGRVFPQPNASDRLILDRGGFLANVILTRDDLYESLDVSYSNLRTVTINTSKTTENNVAVLVTLSNAPTVGNVALDVAGEELYLEFLLARGDLGRFMETLRRRGVGKLNFVNQKPRKNLRQTISIASEVKFTSSSSLLEQRPDFEEKVKHVKEVYDVDDQASSDPVPLIDLKAVPFSLSAGDDHLNGEAQTASCNPTAMSLSTARDDKGPVNLVCNDQQGEPSPPSIEATVAHDLEYPRISGEDADPGPLNISQPQTRQPSRGQKGRKAKTSDSYDPKVATVKHITQSKQLLGSDEVLITDLSIPAEMGVHKCEGQIKAAITSQNKESPMVSTNLIVDTGDFDIDTSAPGLKEHKEQPDHVPVSVDADCGLFQTTNGTKAYSFDVPLVHSSRTEQSKGTKELIAHVDNRLDRTEISTSMEIDRQSRKSQTPAEENRGVSKLGKRRTRQIEPDAECAVTREVEGKGGPRKSRKISDNDVRSGQSANGCQSKTTKLTSSEYATNENENKIESAASQALASDVKRFGKSKITKTKSKSVTAKKGSHAASMQGKGRPRPNPRLVTSAVLKHLDSAPTEENAQVASFPPPITSELATAVDAHNSVPAPIIQIKTIDSVELLDSGTKDSGNRFEDSTKSPGAPPSDSNSPFTVIHSEHQEPSHNSGDLPLYRQDPTCPNTEEQFLLDKVTSFDTPLDLGQSDATLRLKDEGAETRAFAECLIPMKASNDVNELHSKLLIKQSHELGQKEVITCDPLGDGIPDFKRLSGYQPVRGTVPSSPKVSITTVADVIENVHKLPTFPPTPPRKRLSVTFASPIERVMSPAADYTQDRMAHNPIVRLQQRRAQHDSRNLDGKRRSYSSYDDPLSPLPESTRFSMTPSKMTRSLFASSPRDFMSKEGSSSPVQYEAITDEVDIQDIVNVLNDIQAAIIRGISNKFENMRKEVRVCREELLQEVLCDLQLSVTTNARHFNSLVQVEEEYHKYHKTMSCCWEDLIICNDKVLANCKNFLREHDRNLSVKTLPTFILPQRPLFRDRSNIKV